MEIEIGKKTFYLIILIPILVAGIFFIRKSSTGNIVGVSGSSVKADSGGSSAQGDSSDLIKIPISEISNKAKFYTFDTGGTEVKYFVVKSADGQIRTAFDACDVCKGYKGYRQEGNDMVCNNCGRAFDLNFIGTKNRGGGCWPSYLSNSIDGDYVVIKKSELKTAKWMF